MENLEDIIGEDTSYININIGFTERHDSRQCEAFAKNGTVIYTFPQVPWAKKPDIILEIVSIRIHPLVVIKELK